MVKRITLLVVLIFTLSCILSSCKDNAVSPELVEAFNKNEGLWYQFKLKEAKAGLEEILKKDSDYADANRKMAFMEYYYYQDYDKALEHIDKVLEKQPEDTLSNSISGEIYFAEGQYENALKSYKKALDKDSKNTDLYYAIAQTYIKLNKNDEALKALEEGCAVNPFEVKVSSPLHLQYVKDGEYDKAYNIWKNGNAIDKASFGYFKGWDELYKGTLLNKTSNYHAQLGNLYAKLLLYDESAIELTKALKDDPGNTEVRDKLDEVNLFIKFRDELKECFYSYYRRRIINGPAEESSLKNEVENIYKQMTVLFPDIKYNPLNFGGWDSYNLNNEIQKKFNVTIKCFPVDGFMGCYFGYVVGDSVEQVSHWGKTNGMRVILTRNDVINPLEGWYWKINGLSGMSTTTVDENNQKVYVNRIMLDAVYFMAYNAWQITTDKGKRTDLLSQAEKNDKGLIEKPALEVFYSSLLNLQLGSKSVDGLIEEAKTKFHTEEEIKSYAISSLAYDQYIDTYLHEGQHAIDAKYYSFAEWEREYRAKMSEPVYGAMPLMDITHQLKPDIGSNSTAYGKAHTKIFTDIVNYINAHKEDYPAIDTNKNIMMQLSKLSSDDIKEVSKNVFEQVYPGEKYE